MDPNNPSPQIPTPSQTGGQFDPNQFDFIMNPTQAPKKSLLPPLSPKQRLVVFVGIGIVVVLFLVILFSMIFSGGGGATDQVVRVVQTQNEIVRITAMGNQKAGGTEAKTLAAMTNSTISSDQKKTIDYLAEQKKKLKDKDLRLLEEKQTDADLTAAERNGRFDEAFIRIVTEQLTEYRNDLQATYPSLGTNGKELFDQNFKNVDLILKTTQKPSP